MQTQSTLTTVEPGIYSRTSAGRTVFEVGGYGTDGKRFRTSRFEGQPILALKTAREARAKLVANKADGKTVVFSRATFHDYALAWLDSAQVTERTREQYRSTYERHIRPCLGTRKKLTEVTRGDCSRVLAEVAKKKPEQGSSNAKLSAWTIHGIHVVLLNILGQAVEEELIGANPAKELRIARQMKRKARKVEPFLPSEVKTLCEQKGYLGLLFETAIFSGGRQSELLALKWSDVDFEGSVTFERQVMRGGEVVDRLKAKEEGEARVVPIDAQLVRRLKAWKLECEPGEWVFPAPGTGRPYRHITAYRSLQRVCERNDIKARPFHNLRHTFASMLIEGGAAVTQVQQAMGHSSPAITLEVYSHLWDMAATRERHLAAIATARAAIG